MKIERASDSGYTEGRAEERYCAVRESVCGDGTGVNRMNDLRPVALAVECVELSSEVERYDDGGGVGCDDVARWWGGW